MFALGKKQTVQREMRCPLYPGWRPQKRTFAKVMSALPLKEDMCGATSDVG
jgi:hypothetical protein